MKTVSKIALGMLIMSIPLMAFAQPMAGPHPAMTGKMHTGMNLTDEQQTQIEGLRLDHQKKMMTYKDQLRSLKTQMNMLITTDNPSTTDIKKLSGQIGQVSEKIAQEKADHKIKVRNLLTAEQKVKFDMKTLGGKRHMGRRGWGRNAPKAAPGCRGPMGCGMGPCFQHQGPQ